MKPLKVPGYITKNGSLEVNGVYALKQVAELRPGHVMISINYYSQRTNKMNRYLHGVLIPEFRRAMYDAGFKEINTDLIAKNFMKLKFLKFSTTNEDTAEIIEYIKDTSELSKDEMSRLYDDVIQFSAEYLNRIIPYPNEVLTLNFEE